MFSKDMIAPCGLDCSVCFDALDKDIQCPGCYGEDSKKGVYCATCAIVKCGTRKTLPGGFCDACPKYPCADVMEKETRYANAYPMVESPIGNLDVLRREGMDSLLKKEEERWTCPKCGKIICVHTGVCSGCGEKFTVRRPAPAK